VGWPGRAMGGAKAFLDERKAAATTPAFVSDFASSTGLVGVPGTSTIVKADLQLFAAQQ
jgi:hypothetical protein